MRCRVFPIFAGNRIRRMMTAVKYDNSPVRRQDRLLEEEHAAELLRSGEYGFLALGGGRGGYGVPVNYAAEGSRIYIHCAPEGEKLRRIGQDAQAVFCVVGRTAPQPERFTTEYESIMASGVVSVVSDDGERMRALSLIVEKYSPGYEEQGAVYARKSFARTVVLRLDIRSMTGKCKPARQVAAPGGSAAMPCGDGRGCFYADVCGACGAGSSAHMPRHVFRSFGRSVRYGLPKLRICY